MKKPILSLVLWQKVQWNVWPASLPRCLPQFSFSFNTDTKSLSQRLSVCTTTQVFLMPIYVILLSKVGKPVLAPPTSIFKIHNSQFGECMANGLTNVPDGDTSLHYCIWRARLPRSALINSNSHCHKNFTYKWSHIKFTE